MVLEISNACPLQGTKRSSQVLGEYAYISFSDEHEQRTMAVLHPTGDAAQRGCASPPGGRVVWTGSLWTPAALLGGTNAAARVCSRLKCLAEVAVEIKLLLSLQFRLNQTLINEGKKGTLHVLNA